MRVRARWGGWARMGTSVAPRLVGRSPREPRDRASGCSLDCDYPPLRLLTWATQQPHQRASLQVSSCQIAHIRPLTRRLSPAQSRGLELMLKTQAITIFTPVSDIYSVSERALRKRILRFQRSIGIFFIFESNAIQHIFSLGMARHV